MPALILAMLIAQMLGLPIMVALHLEYWSVFSFECGLCFAMYLLVKAAFQSYVASYTGGYTAMLQEFHKRHQTECRH